ncbi:YdeI/OmpD-associated family protein [Streptomyces somaliensis DSM 40738]|nr:YdeI/OmpD-associated family protein [Streptomyces somaliensis]MCQ0022031.1 YdeI/OmpD-associated family protein [Streptomyces somaliensis DSM 40738]
MRQAFEALDRAARYQVIPPLLQARTPRARRERLERAVRALAAGAR